jgi:hypothetical protein
MFRKKCSRTSMFRKNAGGHPSIPDIQKDQKLA